MKNWKIIGLLFLIVLSGCSTKTADTLEEDYTKIGILLSDTGLGDGSFNDSAFRGLEKARDELGILFTYEEAPDGNFEQALEILVKQENDLVIGLGFTAQEPLEAVAKQYPEQEFVLIDSVSALENITSITFKEHEGSFLVGLVAAMVSDTKTFGFIGGVDAPLIHKFEVGFQEGVNYILPDATLLSEYAGDFGNASLGKSIAEKQIAEGAGFIYPAAGFTGVGSIQAAQDKQILSAGVDSDQFFVAEKAVVTSMLKNIDVAVYDIIKELVEKGSISESAYEFGLADGGVGLAPIRVKSLTSEQKALYDEAVEKIKSGEIVVSTTK
ncbi:BMP family lipoprotein [Mangrovibacillus cuniculi]|uniref:BMP family ABC transporter substrate-binding protein n=1 Tax=Mangrovibacillus cuniculi TaxID=2593652 RepID=A0A7S8C9L3_9BACI|nr:BMP family ABC transporter substrate-binding protein [Mangrovibacillus cuniculi]QPC45748.1 BMP family ABC transporter substrate-binding protein [Mangrovibacillus cuniculi]